MKLFPKSWGARITAGIAIMLMAFVFWFVTAPAAMAVQRIASLSGNRTLVLVICWLADAYEAPMNSFDKNPRFRQDHEWMANKWCEILGAPETTP